MTYNKGFNVKPFAIDDLLRSPSSGNGLRHLEDSSTESLRQGIGNNGLRHLEDSFREASTKSIGGNSQAPAEYNRIRYSEDPFEEQIRLRQVSNGLRHLEEPSSEVHKLKKECFCANNYSDLSIRSGQEYSRYTVPRQYTVDSLYELAALPNPFERKNKAIKNEANKRAHNEESREYLERIPALQNVLSNTSINEIPLNERTMNKRVHSVASQNDIAAVPSITKIRSSAYVSDKDVDDFTRNKRVHSAKSKTEIDAVPSLKDNTAASEMDVSLAGSDYAYVTSRGAVKPQIINPHNISAARTAAWVNQSNPNGQKPYQSLHQYDLESEEKEFIDIKTGPRAYLSFAGSDANTMDLHAAIPDIFSNSNNHCYTKIILIPVAPAIKTLNKRAVGDRSLADIHELNVSFEKKRGGASRNNRNQDKSCETLNKHLVTQESIVDLRQLPAIASKSEFGEQVLRDYCVESLEDLRLMPSLSTISLNHEESNVRTAKPIIKNVRENICPL